MKAASGPPPSAAGDGLPGDIIDIADPAEVAKKLPQFEIIELLGRGGMGVVYKARQVNLDRVVALKILPPLDAQSPDFVARFSREARALAKLNHPNIVNVYDFGETGGLYYIIMEFVDGANLRQLFQTRKLTSAEALAIVPKICDALEYAHEEGLVHRDIKPENLLIDKKGRVKIADFGLAKLLRREPLDMTLTLSGMALGTLRYMAPEQMDKPETVDHRADLYSLGVVIYEMLTGDTPVGRFELPSQKAQVDVRFDEIVLHALEREPARRYQHANEVKTDVENVTSKPHVEPVVAAAAPIATESGTKLLLDETDTAARRHQHFCEIGGMLWILMGVLGSVFVCQMNKFGFLPIPIASLLGGVGLMIAAGRIRQQWKIDYLGHSIRFENSVYTSGRLMIDGKIMASGGIGPRTELSARIPSGPGAGDQIVVKTHALIRSFQCQIFVEAKSFTPANPVKSGIEKTERERKSCIPAWQVAACVLGIVGCVWPCAIVEHGFFGGPTTLSEDGDDLSGIYVATFFATDAPAGMAGVISHDTILSIAGRPTHLGGMDGPEDIWKQTPVGADVEIKVKRNGKEVALHTVRSPDPIAARVCALWQFIVGSALILFVLSVLIGQPFPRAARWRGTAATLLGLGTLVLMFFSNEHELANPVKVVWGRLPFVFTGEWLDLGQKLAVWIGALTLLLLGGLDIRRVFSRQTSEANENKPAVENSEPRLSHFALWGAILAAIVACVATFGFLHATAYGIVDLSGEPNPHDKAAVPAMIIAAAGVVILFVLHHFKRPSGIRASLPLFTLLALGAGAGALPWPAGADAGALLFPLLTGQGVLPWHLEISAWRIWHGAAFSIVYFALALVHIIAGGEKSARLRAASLLAGGLAGLALVFICAMSPPSVSGIIHNRPVMLPSDRVLASIVLSGALALLTAIIGAVQLRTLPSATVESEQQPKSTAPFTRVRTPGETLMLLGGVGLFMALGIALWLALAERPAWESFTPEAVTAARAKWMWEVRNLTAMAVTLAVHGLFTCFSGWLMRRLRARMFVLACLVLVGVILPGVIAVNVIMEFRNLPQWPVCIPLWLAVPACVWAITVLFQDDVREAFASVPAKTKPGTEKTARDRKSRIPV